MDKDVYEMCSSEDKHDSSMQSEVREVDKVARAYRREVRRSHSSRFESLIPSFFGNFLCS